MLEYLIKRCHSVEFRGKARLLNLIGPRSGARFCSLFGLNFELDLEDYIQRHIYFGAFEPYETRLVKTYLRPGMTFVDVGANVGYYTALASSLVGKPGSVIAFEPSPYAFGRLRSMVQANKLEHVRPVHSGLSDVAGQLNLYLGNGSHNHTPTMVPHENATVTLVSVQTLDSAAEQMGIERIDLMKIDVEGYETRVLAGATRLLKEGRVRAILCEFNDHWLRQAGSSPEKLKSIISSAGLIEASATAQNPHADNRFFRLP